ncbi:MAG: hypothetical protein ACLU3F_02950 [Blautia wexlerae]
MSVGKDSILRAANAEAKNTETKAEPVKPARRSKSSGRSQRSTKGRS